MCYIMLDQHMISYNIYIGQIRCYIYCPSQPLSCLLLFSKYIEVGWTVQFYCCNPILSIPIQNMRRESLLWNIFQSNQRHSWKKRLLKTQIERTFKVWAPNRYLRNLSLCIVINMLQFANSLLVDPQSVLTSH